MKITFDMMNHFFIMSSISGYRPIALKLGVTADISRIIKKDLVC